VSASDFFMEQPHAVSLWTGLDRVGIKPAICEVKGQPQLAERD
jgi:hypothetical protein